MKFFAMDCPSPSSISRCCGSRRANVSVDSTARIANSLTCLVGPGLAGLAKSITERRSKSGRTKKERWSNGLTRMGRRGFDLWCDSMPEAEKASQSGQPQAIVEKPQMKNPSLRNSQFHVGKLSRNGAENSWRWDYFPCLNLTRQA